MDRLEALRNRIDDRYPAWTVAYCTATWPATCPDCFEREALSQSLRELGTAWLCEACGSEFDAGAVSAPAGRP